MSIRPVKRLAKSKPTLEGAGVHPWGIQALAGEISEPAWKSKPSWYLLATENRMIPPPAQRFMSGSTVVEVAASHAIYVSQPNAVAAVIKQAAQGAAAATAVS